MYLINANSTQHIANAAQHIANSTQILRSSFDMYKNHRRSLHLDLHSVPTYVTKERRYERCTALNLRCRVWNLRRSSNNNFVKNVDACIGAR